MNPFILVVLISASFFGQAKSTESVLCLEQSPVLTATIDTHHQANVLYTATITATKTLSPASTYCVTLRPEEEERETPPSGNQEPYGQGTHPHWIIIGSLCILLAVFFIVFSFQYFIFTLAIVGFLFAGASTWLILTLAEPLEGYRSATLVYTCSCLGAGVTVGGAAMYFWNFAFPFMGGFSGFLVGVFLWMWKEDHIIINVYARIFTAIGVGVALAVLTYVVESMVVVVATSFFGGFLFVLGLDLLLHTGLLQAIRSLFNPNPFRKIDYHVDNKIYAMLSAILAVFIVSVILQSYLHRGRRFGVNIVKFLEPPM